MAKSGSSRGRDSSQRRSGAGRPARPGRSAAASGRPSTPKRPTKPVAKPAPVEPERAPAASFRLGVIAGATPGKWIDAWKERMPRTDLALHPLTFAEQRDALLAGVVDAAIVRLPVDERGLHVIALYDDLAVVVTSADSHLTAAAELDLADLAGEVLIVPADDVLGVSVPNTVDPIFARPETTEDAIATVAAGVGIVVVPMSVARLHHRRDTEYRPLRGATPSTVAIAWVAEATTPEIEAFVGIVRGRTANSSRT